MRWEDWVMGGAFLLLAAVMFWLNPWRKGNRFLDARRRRGVGSELEGSELEGTMSSEKGARAKW